MTLEFEKSPKHFNFVRKFVKSVGFQENHKLLIIFLQSCALLTWFDYCEDANRELLKQSLYKTLWFLRSLRLG